ncbi:hypothetical protein EROM_050190 [Encephalitozoon romaleae SJ-2008]|uniref:Uncharacterized protein n=1 Tax=Encephalitozoon romaleae (strain SJ-2008) TaxID=1178016 RepID=I7ARF3_ENCRO|nr:hypothetical protein EROM_050190 [Encephalitozoon romaleae SJ-2008]AFN82952.1 hypothetical protein EROM_050190 [Encephalitozoon romaleae SJ-2008]
MEPTDIYKYYSKRATEFLRPKEIRKQVEEIKRMKATVVIFDFCGKIPLVYKLFAGVKKEVFVVYDASKCKERIDEISRDHDLIYVLEDIQAVERSIFHENSNAIFLLFDRFKFIRCA